MRLPLGLASSLVQRGHSSMPDHGLMFSLKFSRIHGHLRDSGILAFTSFSGVVESLKRLRVEALEGLCAFV